MLSYATITNGATSYMYSLTDSAFTFTQGLPVVIMAKCTVCPWGNCLSAPNVVLDQHKDFITLQMKPPQHPIIAWFFLSSCPMARALTTRRAFTHAANNVS